jgi:hypothetical protein
MIEQYLWHTDVEEDSNCCFAEAIPNRKSKEAVG